MHFLLRLLKLITEYVHFLIGAAILVFAGRDGLNLLQEHAHDVDERLLWFALMLATALFLPIVVEMKKRLWSRELSRDPYPDPSNFEKPYSVVFPTGFAQAAEAYKIVHKLFRRFHFPEDVELENFKRNKFAMVVVQDKGGDVVGAIDLFCLKKAALDDLLNGRQSEPEIRIENLEFPANQTEFYISAFSARPFTSLAGEQGEYLLKQQRQWIAKSLVYGMAKMLDRYYFGSSAACGRKLDEITLYALAYRRAGERWLKLAGFDLTIVPSANKSVKYRIASILRFVLSLFGINAFGKLAGGRYPVYKLAANRKLIMKFLKGHASFAEGATFTVTNPE
jgi:hypothetical protein